MTEPESVPRIPSQEPADPVVLLQADLQRYEVAIENISIGICFFDAGQRLIVSNRRYALMYGLTPEHVRPGMTMKDIIDLRMPVGSVPDTSPDTLAALIAGAIASEPEAGTLRYLRNGRYMLVRHTALPGGGWVATHEDVTDRCLAERRLLHLAHHDLLTDLPTRALLAEHLQRALGGIAGGQCCAILCVDLDQFKHVNDTMGHSVGDAVLKSAADRMREVVAAPDMVARIGGDGFGVVQCAGLQPDDALRLAERLIEALGRPCVVEGHPVRIGASVGIAMAPEHGDDADMLMRNAALALTFAKSSGRSRPVVYTPDMNAAVQRRRTMESDLRSAVTDNSLSLVFQPVANLQTGRVTGFEALLRWDRPLFGRVSPAEFIPIAEETGLIVPIGAWVLRRACIEAALWPRWLRVAVNVSAAQFRAHGLYEAVVGALAASGLAPSRLELEITESAMMQNWQETAGLLQRLTLLGVRVAMDDFGTGYSSLSYLRKFPFDKIKIDQAFVRELTANRESVAIVRAIVALCGTLGMTTCAEGVETQEQFDILKSEGCTEVQGYLLSAPRPVSEVIALLDQFDSANPVARPVKRPAFVPG